jgi:hypothetical protein
VFFDRERFGQRRFAFLAIAAAVIIVCLGVRLTTGALTCLLTIDYIWNAWHFASQHHGIYRIYANRTGVGSRLRQPYSPSVPALPQSTRDPFDSTTPIVPPLGLLALEKWSMRLFLLYVILRVAGATWSYAALEQSLRIADWAILAIPAWLLIRELARQPRAAGRTVYLLSVMTLYISLLAAVHATQPALVLSLATASAVFHATEYLALVAWSVYGRHSAKPDQLGIMSYLAPRWGLALGIFILVLGAGGWMLQKNYLQTWLLVNVIVAFLHYAYDGLIWRRS